MKQTTTPSKTPSPKKAVSSSQQITVGKAENPSSLFTGMALDMSWRLAIVVLVPIIGGFELDSHAGTTPLLTVLGFILAVGGVVLVMRRTLQVANQATAQPNVTVQPTQEKRS